ncbi:hypothetical protein CVD28_05605 [Bacillus sp. M6-12]|uniref:hypothetical protein n=1 Tax=Bacillus sp. M6-12 TaxID=2054166 RepID=UPI000C777A8B|nr:hypothetical protein [Bacillus sp. M6-12]PLS18613.1 hypothetical protein CVD28_05605 [Bacillus sp. M6-12]
MPVAGLISEEEYGTDARSVNELIERLTTIDWYTYAGKIDHAANTKLDQLMSNLGVKDYEIQWLSKEEVPEAVSRIALEKSALWDVLKDLPEELKNKIDINGNEKLLEDIVDRVPELVFHGAYMQAFHLFGDENAVKYLVGHAMYISILACSAELAGEEDIFSPLLELLEMGHLPLGPNGNIFYLL